MIEASACSKIILFGEHAVVYGQPAIAVPLVDLRAHVTLQPSEVGLVFELPRLTESIHCDTTPSHPFCVLVQNFSQRYEHNLPNVCIKITSQIPIASGLGSGAAISTAIVRGLGSYLDIEIPLETQNELVYAIEKLFHGTPSGIDNSVIVFEKPLFFIREHALEMLENKLPFRILIGDTGVTAETHVAVSAVRQLYEERTSKTRAVIDEIGRIAYEARDCMKRGSWRDLGALMNHNHRLLQTLTVSTNQLDLLVTQAVEAGALGAKLSGGGRGGNMIALVEERDAENVTEALLKTGAHQVISTLIPSVTR